MLQHIQIFTIGISISALFLLLSLRHGLKSILIALQPLHHLLRLKSKLKNLGMISLEATMMSQQLPKFKNPNLKNKWSQSLNLKNKSLLLNQLLFSKWKFMKLMLILMLLEQRFWLFKSKDLFGVNKSKSSM